MIKLPRGRIQNGGKFGEWLNSIAELVCRMATGWISVDPPLECLNGPSGVSIRLAKEIRDYHSHQAKTLEEMDPGDTADVRLYIEESAVSGDDGLVEATLSPTIAEAIPTDTWVDLAWRPTEDGVGRWEIVGYYFECPEE